MTQPILDSPVSDLPTAAAPQPANASRATLTRLWAAAAGLGALGAWTIFDARPGLNWPLWTVLAVVGFVVCFRATGRSLGQGVVVPLVGACVFSIVAAVTANPFFHLLIFITVAVSLACAVLLGGGASAARAGVVFIARSPIVAGARVLVEAGRRALEVTGVLRAERSVPVLRGLVIALPVVGVFALLLSAADPMFAAWRDAIFKAIEQLEFVPRLVFFVGVTTVVLGAYGSVLRPVSTEREPFMFRAPRLNVGDTERLIVLGAVAALFGLFLAVQTSYFFGNVAAVKGSGVTFAEYARRGFAELSVVATLCSLLILSFDRLAVRGPRDGQVRLLSLVLLGEVQLLLASAWHRVNLYADAYGYTTARLYAQVYMVVLSVVLVLLAREVVGAIDTARLGRRAALLGGGVFALLGFWNHEAWIVGRNVERFERTGKLDVAYLGRDLSYDALPAVVRAMRELPAPEAQRLRACLALGGSARGGFRITEADRWYEWNVRRARAREAFEQAGMVANWQASDASTVQAICNNAPLVGPPVQQEPTAGTQAAPTR